MIIEYEEHIFDFNRMKNGEFRDLLILNNCVYWKIRDSYFMTSALRRLGWRYVLGTKEHSETLYRLYIDAKIEEAIFK